MNKLLISLLLLLILNALVHSTSNISSEEFKSTSLKYILQWTSPKTEPFNIMGKGQEVFIERRCPVNNCFISSQKTFLDNITSYDAILFHGPNLNRKFISFPPKRSLHQKYVFVSMESSAYYPLCNARYESFFNWTWTYILNSDEYFGYIIIKNKSGDIIGPKKVMQWLRAEYMSSIDMELKDKLKNKNIAAAWFVSNCGSPSGRDEVAKRLRNELSKYNMTLDIYGRCGNKKCPKEKMADCLQQVEKDYYFYLSFENSFSDDYVTEKLLTALQHYAVPIVYGGANYTRFMPDGSYLNARTLNIEELVEQMLAAIHNKEKYYDYFRWHNHYSYHSLDESTETDPYCQFCKRINDVNLVKQISIYNNFRKWWNSNDSGVAACPSPTDFHAVLTLSIAAGLFAVIIIFFYLFFVISHVKRNLLQFVTSHV